MEAIPHFAMEFNHSQSNPFVDIPLNSNEPTSINANGQAIPPLPAKKKSLKITQSCPSGPTRSITSIEDTPAQYQRPIVRRQSSVHSLTKKPSVGDEDSAGSKATGSVKSPPPFVRQSSILSASGGSRVPADADFGGIQSATSSSLLYGAVLIAITVTSFTAFILAKIRNPCDDEEFRRPDPKCPEPVANVYFASTIITAIASFILCFLHFIGHCDYISWSARRKVALEMIINALLGVFITCATIFVSTDTRALNTRIGIASVSLAATSVICMCFRNILLHREFRMLR